MLSSLHAMCKVREKKIKAPNPTPKIEKGSKIFFLFLSFFFFLETPFPEKMEEEKILSHNCGGLSFFPFSFSSFNGQGRRSGWPIRYLAPPR